MDNQHQLIKGYRDLTQQGIDLMNEGKALAEECREYIEKVKAAPDIDGRWLSIGVTDLQKGLYGRDSLDCAPDDVLIKFYRCIAGVGSTVNH
jgi:hypothetical protein